MVLYILAFTTDFATGVRLSQNKLRNVRDVYVASPLQGNLQAWNKKHFVCERSWLVE